MFKLKYLNTKSSDLINYNENDCNHSINSIEQDVLQLDNQINSKSIKENIENEYPWLTKSSKQELNEINLFKNINFKYKFCNINCNKLLSNLFNLIDDNMDNKDQIIYIIQLCMEIIINNNFIPYHRLYIKYTTIRNIVDKLHKIKDEYCNLLKKTNEKNQILKNDDDNILFLINLLIEQLILIRDELSIFVHNKENNIDLININNDAEILTAINVVQQAEEILYNLKMAYSDILTENFKSINPDLNTNESKLIEACIFINKAIQYNNENSNKTKDINKLTSRIYNAYIRGTTEDAVQVALSCIQNCILDSINITINNKTESNNNIVDYNNKSGKSNILDNILLFSPTSN